MNAFKLTMVASVLGTLVLISANPAAAGACDSSLTRAQVRADVQAARAAGELGAMTGEDSGSFHFAREAARQMAASTRSRAEVMAEALRERDSGQSVALVGEDSGSAWLARQPSQSTRTRAEVLAEAIEANRLAQLMHVTGEDGGASGVAVVAPREPAERLLAGAGPLSCPVPLAHLRLLAAAR